MVDTFEIFADVIEWCWDFLTMHEFVFAGITFTLANVMEVGVFIWVFNLIVDGLLGGDALED